MKNDAEKFQDKRATAGLTVTLKTQSTVDSIETRSFRGRPLCL